MMSLVNLDNLVNTGHLKKEEMSEQEFIGLLNSGEARLRDAKNTSLALESRFDLAYNAAHALSLSALRWHGYRSNNRYIVFQVLPYTLKLGPEIWRILAKCHERRNMAEYEGYLEINVQLLEDLLSVTEKVLNSLNDLIQSKSST